MKLARLAALAVVSLYLSGCAGPMKSVVYDREIRPAGSTIVILPMLESELQHRVYNNPADNHIISAAIAAGVETSRQNHLRRVFDDFDINDFFREELAMALAEREYQVVLLNPGSFRRQVVRTVEGTMDATPREFQTDQRHLRRYPQPDPEGRALLDVGLVFAGYAASGVGASSPYRPTVQVHVRLLGADGKNVLFQDTIAYHNVFGSTQMITLEPNPDHSYPTWEGLRDTDADQLRAELQEALAAVARAIAQQL